MDELTWIPDTILPSDNALEIPTLRLDRQPEFVSIPFVCYGEQKRTFQMNHTGTLHFYTDDYRFSAVFEHPETILKHNPANIVEPNFSCFSETPVAFGMQAIYKKRFISRAMQEKGINVFVDLNVNSKFYKLNMIGVPRGYHSFCTRGYSDRVHYLEFEYNIAKEWAEGNRLTFIIYGGGEPCKEFARMHANEANIVYMSQMVNIKKKTKALEKIAETVSFFGEKEDVSEILTAKKMELIEGQMTDFTKQVESSSNHKNARDK